jgi:CrcB protein
MAVVAAGGAIGATGRWAIAELFASSSTSWEWPTLIVNIVGSLAIGIAARRLRPATRSWEFTVTGVLGGFTTFSAFAVVANDLVDAGRDGMALAYGVVTLLSGESRRKGICTTQRSFSKIGKGWFGAVCFKNCGNSFGFKTNERCSGSE